MFRKLKSYGENSISMSSIQKLIGNNTYNYNLNTNLNIIIAGRGQLELLTVIDPKEISTKGVGLRKISYGRKVS